MKTAQQLYRQARHMDRITARAATVLADLADGARLHTGIRNGLPYWWLSGGRGEVPNEVAERVIRDSRVVPVGKALFENLPAQSYRHTDQ